MDSMEMVHEELSPMEPSCGTPARDGKAQPGLANSLEESHPVSRKETGSLKLNVKYAQRLVQASDDVYDTTTDPPGRVLLLTYRTFPEGEDNLDKTRIGAEHDASNLLSLFTQMGYDVESHMDKTKEQSISILQDFSSSENLSEVGCAIVVVSSHGGEMSPFFSTSDGKEISIDYIHGLFTKSRNKKVRDMPKLFFFSFCRGNKEPEYYTDSPAPAPNNNISFFSTAEDFLSFRDPKSGSKFLSVWCEVLAESAWEDSLDDLFRKVQRRYTKNPLGSTPEKRDLGFQKKFYFNPRPRKF